MLTKAFGHTSIRDQALRSKIACGGSLSCAPDDSWTEDVTKELFKTLQLESLADRKKRIAMIRLREFEATQEVETERAEKRQRRKDAVAAIPMRFDVSDTWSRQHIAEQCMARGKTVTYARQTKKAQLLEDLKSRDKDIPIAKLREYADERAIVHSRLSKPRILQKLIEYDENMDIPDLCVV